MFVYVIQRSECKEMVQAHVYTHGEQRRPPGCGSISACVCVGACSYYCVSILSKCDSSDHTWRPEIRDKRYFIVPEGIFGFGITVQLAK